MSSLLQDIRFAWRLAARQPLASMASLATLALGLGATTALFSVANAWLLTPLPFRDPDRLTMVWETIPSAGIDQNTPAPAVLRMWRERNRSYDDLAAWTRATLKLTGGPEPLRVNAARVSSTISRRWRFRCWPAVPSRPRIGWARSTWRSSANRSPVARGPMAM